MVNTKIKKRTLKYETNYNLFLFVMLVEYKKEKNANTHFDANFYRISEIVSWRYYYEII